MLYHVWDALTLWLSAGLTQFNWWQDIIVTLVLTHITIVGVTVFLHRCQAHRALDLHPIPSHFFRFWLWLTTGMVTKQWVAIHRKHHARCETKEDPHSPQILGIGKVFFRGAELYREAALDSEMVERYSKGTPDDWMERNVYIKHDWLGILLMLGIDILLFGLPGLTIWAIQMAWIPLFAAGVINGIGHYWGYRNFECTDAATNILPWGILIGGEELHNNHHTFGTSAKLSVKKWEFDIGWMYICILRALGMAKVKRTPPKLVSNPNKAVIDGDTLKAILSNRFQVLASYSKEVINPVFKHESQLALAQGAKISRRVKCLMKRDDSIVKAKDEACLRNVLSSNGRLDLVYQYRNRLQKIWACTTASQKELIDDIKDWCVQAERTGVKVLYDFAARMRTFVPATQAV